MNKHLTKAQELWKEYATNLDSIMRIKVHYAQTSMKQHASDLQEFLVFLEKIPTLWESLRNTDYIKKEISNIKEALEFYRDKKVIK